MLQGPNTDRCRCRPVLHSVRSFCHGILHKRCTTSGFRQPGGPGTSRPVFNYQRSHWARLTKGITTPDPKAAAAGYDAPIPTLNTMYDDEIAAIKRALNASDVSFVGEGQYAVTFRVEESTQVTALKLFKNPYDLARTAREMESLNFVKSRNVVRFIDEGSIAVNTENRRYFRTEFIDGETLEAHIIKIGKYRKKELLDLAIQLAQGLDALQLRGIVHRDLKPENIIIENTGRVVIVDLGLAKRQGAARVTASGTFLGTGLYAAPEQFGGAAHVDIRADIFALGVILYEAAAAAGSHPFDCHANMTLQEIYEALRTKPVKNHPIPSFRKVIRKMLHVKPFNRIKSPGALLNALNGIR